MLGIRQSKGKKADKVLPNEHRINIEKLAPGMLMARDVVDGQGRLVVSRGTVVTEILRDRLINYFRAKSITEQVVVSESKYV